MAGPSSRLVPLALTLAGAAAALTGIAQFSVSIALIAGGIGAILVGQRWPR